MSSRIELIPLSSLSKVFLEQTPEPGYVGGSMLKNEKYSFQVAYTVSAEMEARPFIATLKIESPLKDFISIRLVGNLPSVTPIYPNKFDDNYLSIDSGLFPDPLYKINRSEVKVLPNKWQSIWVIIEGSKNLAQGKYPIKITFCNSEKGLESTVSIEVEVVNCELPDQDLIYTNWFHADCIASVYNCDVFSEEHWKLIEQFVDVAAKYGMNMILTPAFTPPLDTPIGDERITVQLVDVYKDGNNYEFNFDRLNRWIDICLEKGISYFEHSHLFTQWGAKFAPKVVGYENDEYKKMFGWDTSATSKEYVNFLQQYLPSVISFFKKKNIDDKIYFHISDEPTIDNLETYAKAVGIVKDYLQGYKVFDALSSFEFYKKGLVPIPVPTTSHFNDFLGKVDEPWLYYTGGQCIKYSNRFFSMPSTRNRILGTQMYKYDIKGFLQWAYNFYYTTMSKEICNPLFSTDAFGEFPSGTAYMVYPGCDGPIESLRLVVFNEGIQDIRAMKCLESYIGKDGVMQIIEENIDPITLSEYPKTEKYLLDMRNRINREIAKYN